MALDAWLKLLAFMALVCACSLYGLAASGQFPREHRTLSLRSPAGGMLLFGSMAVTSLAAAAGVTLAARSLPWYAVVIGGGLVLLAAPLLLRPFPDRVVNGGAALAIFAAIAALLAIIIAAGA